MQLPGYHPGQLMRTDTSLLYCLRDEGIDPGELCIAQFDIYTAQNVDGIRNRFPVERRILGNVKTQVLIQRLNCLLRTALCVSGVDLIIRYSDNCPGIPIQGGSHPSPD